MLKTAMLVLIASLCLIPGCSKPRTRLTLGGQGSTEQAVILELLAQSIEAKTDWDVQRRIGLTSTPIIQQALLMNEIDLYPENLGALAANILKETPDKDPSIVMERVKAELDRIARVQIVGPLGYENPFVVVVRASDAAEKHLENISDTQGMKPGWELASTSDFLGRPDGNTALQSTYNIPMKAIARPMPLADAYRLLKQGHITMVAGVATDGTLTDPELKVLKDDRKAFPPALVCAVTRADVIQVHPELRDIVSELAKKLSTTVVRKLDSEVDSKHRQPRDVAAEFLAGRGQ